MTCLEAFPEQREKRVCRVIGNPELGWKENGSAYRGTLYLLQQNVADMLVKTEQNSVLKTLGRALSKMIPGLLDNVQSIATDFKFLYYPQ